MFVLKIRRVFSLRLLDVRCAFYSKSQPITEEILAHYLHSLPKCTYFGKHICDTFASGPVRVLKMTQHNCFKLTDYDWVGFDLDNTLCQYNVQNMMKMEYNVLSKFLVESKGYDGRHLLQPLDEDLNYIQKGLMIDFDNGNLLQIGKNGKVLRACHGTRLLEDYEVTHYYGQDRMWTLAAEFYEDILGAWNGPLSLKLRTLLDSFDMPAALAFARIIDTLDENEGRKQEKYNVWRDVLDGLISMYQRENFAMNTGGFFPSMKMDPELYINRCSDTLIYWLKALKKQAKTFLVTGSNADFASFVAKNSLGNNWLEYFDVVICFARKPGFFTSTREFIATEDFKETVPLSVSDLRLNEVYSQGNWNELVQFFSKTVGKENFRCVYIGDNLIQDIYVPSKFVDLDTVAVVDDMLEEQQVSVDSSSKGVSSLGPWTSYFGCEKHGSSIWSEIIRKHSKICVPSVDALAERSVDYSWTSFSFEGNSCKEQGFQPNTPVSFL